MATEGGSGVERIAAAFAGHGRRAALMPYTMAGFPDLETSLRIGRAYVEGGADLIELGVPFSDPLADGPTIQAAGQRALEVGTTVEDALGIAERLAPEVPVVLMCYANLVVAGGAERFVERLGAAGAVGLIVPDLPVEEAGELLATCDGRSLALVQLVAPTTTEERLARISAAARGFVYLVSVAGVTGERGQLPPELPEFVARVRRHTELPLAVGFGVSSPEHAGAVAELADGVIVGSRLVRAFADAPSTVDGLAAVGAFMKETALALA